MQVSQATEAVSREQHLKEQLRQQLSAAAADSKRQVSTHDHVVLILLGRSETAVSGPRTGSSWL